MTRKTTLETARQGCRAPRSSALAALLACAALGLAAAPARAGNEFKNGFEDQIGRLLAFQVFQAGQVILGAPGYGYGYAWAVRPAPRPLYPPRHWHHAHRHPRREPCAWERESSRGRGSARR
jgi:hypothetical protein